MKILVLSCVSLLAIGGISFSKSESNSKKPNILVFLVDDMGWQDTSVPFHKEKTPLNDRYRTPNMERLAESAVKFTQAYAAPSCSPSRNSFMTGMSAARHKITVFTLNKGISPERNTTRNGLRPAIWPCNGLSPVSGIEQTTYCPQTLPQVLRDAGYWTIHSGKAHWGARNTPGADPKNFGYHVNIAGHAAGGPGSYYGEKNFSARWRNGGNEWDVPGLEKYHRKNIFLSEALTLETVSALNEWKEKHSDRPFFLHFAHYAVHVPIEADPRYIQNYANLSKSAAGLATLIEGMDKSLGDILKWLEENNQRDNTVLVFMSDNGASPQNPRNLPLRGCKLTRYEAGTRVPLLVYLPKNFYPQAARKAISCAEPTLAEDLFPSVIEIAGVDAKSIKHPIDGRSWLSFCQNPEQKSSPRDLIWHYPNTWQLNPWSSIRRGDWKLIHDYATKGFELYNLAEDIGESKNLIFTQKEKARELVEGLRTGLEKRTAIYPRNPDGSDVEAPSIKKLEVFYEANPNPDPAAPLPGRDQEQRQQISK